LIFILVLCHMTFNLRVFHFWQTNFAAYVESTGCPIRGLLFLKLHRAYSYLLLCWFSVASKCRRNCAERLQARQDVPMARAVQTDEELQLQLDHMRHIEQLKAMYICLFLSPMYSMHPFVIYFECILLVLVALTWHGDLVNSFTYISLMPSWIKLCYFCYKMKFINSLLLIIVDVSALTEALVWTVLWYFWHFCLYRILKNLTCDFSCNSSCCLKTFRFLIAVVNKCSDVCVCNLHAGLKVVVYDVGFVLCGEV